MICFFIKEVKVHSEKTIVDEIAQWSKENGVVM